MLAPNYRVGLYYGSSTCYTEMAAEKIRDYFGTDEDRRFWIEVINIAEAGFANTSDYQMLIFGIPTWDYGELQEDWDRVWDSLDSLDLSNKIVALYGLGDQIGYPEWFQDAMGYLYHKVIERGARVIGFWPATGYQFNCSQALTPDKKYFVGLPLDDETEFDLSEARIQQWCEQLREEMDAV